MDNSTLWNYVLGAYGVLLTTYTVWKANKERKRRLSVKLSTGWQPYFRDGRLGPQLLLITVVNTGNRKVTVNAPYLELPDGKNLFTPIPLTNVRFPHRLEDGDNCMIWIEMNEIKNSLLKQGYSGTVKFKGRVSDGTGKVFKSKEAWDFDINAQYD